MEPHPVFKRSGLTCYLFIYVVRDVVKAEGSEALGYCTILAYGRSLEAAEQVAINRVSQQDLHIVRADTATAAPWLDPSSDERYLEELSLYGSALQFTPPATATAA